MKTKYNQGGVVEGQTHNQGGTPAVDSAGNHVAEIEGGERIFSVEDTSEMEKMAGLVNQSQGEKANELAMELGFKVSNMVKSQDKRAEVPTDDEFLLSGGDEPDNTVDEYIE